MLGLYIFDSLCQFCFGILDYVTLVQDAVKPFHVFEVGDIVAYHFV